MWSLIERMRQGRAVVLTTHSMEEADALCHRIAIMKQGQLLCIGPSQHLKSKFGGGYRIEIKTSPDSSRERLESFMKINFPQARLVESHGNMHYYELKFRDERPDGDESLPEDAASSREPELSLAVLFSRLHGGKEEIGIVDYSVSQTTLEQIFIKMVKEETIEEGISDEAVEEDEETGMIQGRQKKSKGCRCCC